MIGSFFSGLSGLRSNQTKLEVIGSNIANANTIGFKTAHVQFGDMLARTVRSATSAEAPVQIGRGAQVTAVTTKLTQGGLQESGVDTDFAIQGRGFFVVSDGDRQLYTRAGNFLVDENNQLVTQDGMSLVGFNAVNGQIPVSAVSEAISFPTEPLAAQPTSVLTFQGNLGSATPVLTVDADDNIARIGGRDGVIGTGIAGTVSLSDDGTTINVTGSGTDFSGLNAGDALIIDGRPYSIDAVADATNLTLTRPTLTGTIEAAAGSNAVLGTNTLFTSELSVGDALNIDGQDVTVTAIRSDTQLTVSTPAANDVAAGAALELGQAGGILAASGATAELPTAPDSSTLLAELPGNVLIGRLETANILVTDTLSGAKGVVSVTGTNSLAELEQAVREAGFIGYAINSDQFKLSKLDGGNGITTSTQVIDSQGNSHLAIFTAFRTEDPNTWAWRMELPDAANFAQDAGVDLGSNSQGLIEFNADGSISSFRNLQGAEQFTLQAKVGDADIINIQMDQDVVGEVTQYNLPSDLTLGENNGSRPGTFQTFTLDTNGLITGNFSNGKSRVIGQVLLADFANPQGLAREGANLFMSTVNSGSAAVGTPGNGNFGLTISGSVELSNVDLAEQFIEMILAQRGLQSSANVITTGDQIMNDLLVLKR